MSLHKATVEVVAYFENFTFHSKHWPVNQILIAFSTPGPHQTSHARLQDSSNTDQLLYWGFLQSGTVYTVRILSGSITYLNIFLHWKYFLRVIIILYFHAYQQMTAQRPSSRARGFLRGSLNSMSLKSLSLSSCCGVRTISVLPSGPILVSTSFFCSDGSQLVSEQRGATLHSKF